MEEKDEADDNDDGVDIVGIIALETHLKTSIYFIKKSAQYHKDFWQELLLEKPKLNKLNEIGNDINFSIKNINENWQKLIKINFQMPSIYKLYGHFLKSIMNEND